MQISMFDTQATYSCMSSGPMYPSTHSLPSCRMATKPTPVPELKARADPKPLVAEAKRLQAITDMDFDESFDEEEDFSEDDCEMEDFSLPAKTEDVSNQLLQFAEMVNGDIQKYFGRKKGEDDSCDIYEDKWASRKSGRELYYADLLRVAQGDDGEDKKKADDKKADNKEIYSGKMDPTVGLGPLEELFERSIKEAKCLNAASGSKSKDNCLNSARKFPESFWTEPKSSCFVKKQTTVANKTEIVKAQGTLLGQSKTPDFTDLLESWTGEDGGQLSSGNLSIQTHGNNEHGNRR